jgi:hypothetical protein
MVFNMSLRRSVIGTLTQVRTLTWPITVARLIVNTVIILSLIEPETA